MIRRGDIMVERLTSKRLMVIDMPSADEVTCRFADGRLEDRFLFELDLTAPTIWDSVIVFVKSFLGSSEKPPLRRVAATGRPRLARQSTSSQ
jgi:hypothetical protein